MNAYMKEVRRHKHDIMSKYVTNFASCKSRMTIYPTGTVVTGVVFSFCHKIISVHCLEKKLERTMKTPQNLAYKPLQKARLLISCVYCRKYEPFL